MDLLGLVLSLSLPFGPGHPRPATFAISETVAIDSSCWVDLEITP